VSLLSHFVTDRRRLGLTPSALADRAARAARSGVDVIQVRERDLDDRDLAALVGGIVDAVRGTPARVLVNDRADVAMAAGAHGVHLRGDSPIASRVRGIVPAGFIVGRSVHTSVEIDAAVADGGCDYLLFGTVFASAGKPAGHAVAGLDALRAACSHSPIPVIAIGGIDETKLASIEEAGAAGFAAIGMFG
jgi:thiamine-phosphate pyrophosphorylase